jgi:hypothetical protein
LLTIYPSTFKKLGVKKIIQTIDHNNTVSPLGYFPPHHRRMKKLMHTVYTFSLAWKRITNRLKCNFYVFLAGGQGGEK